MKRVEVAFVLLVACVLSAVALLSCRTNYGKTECTYNLKTMYLEYATFWDQGGARPRTNARPGSAIALFNEFVPSNNTPAWNLICPKDSRARPGTPGSLANNNISYFFSENPPPQSPGWILSGNRNLTNAGAARLPPAPTGWDGSSGLHGLRGYILLLDGSVMLTDDSKVTALFAASGNSTNRIAFPR